MRTIGSAAAAALVLLLELAGASVTLPRIPTDRLPVFQPYDAPTIERCRLSCERKRSACFAFSVGSTVLCEVSKWAAGWQGKTACSVFTAPWSVDCSLNSLRCYRDGCGLVGARVRPRFVRMFRKLNRPWSLPIVFVPD